MLRKILQELIAIRKELQAIRSSMESDSRSTFQSKPDYRVIRENGVVKRVRSNR
mgnify:CR=1 FL=1